jgi:hypothetical protein
MRGSVNSKTHIETSCLGLKQSHNHHPAVVVLALRKAGRSRLDARHEPMDCSDDLSWKHVLQTIIRSIALNVRGYAVFLMLGLSIVFDLKPE